MNITSLQKRLLPTFHQHKINKAILFGSFARGKSSSEELEQIAERSFIAQALREGKILYDMSLSKAQYEAKHWLKTAKELIGEQ